MVSVVAALPPAGTTTEPGEQELVTGDPVGAAQAKAIVPLNPPNEFRVRV
jgi:hypothetical protein